MVNKPDILAVIPARGGSKRIPLKNIKNFKGRPIISWTIEAAMNTGLFGHVLVSTDCAEIAEVAIAEGAESPFLRDATGDDYTPVSLATLHALEQAESYYEKIFDVVVQLMANCPLRSAGTINDMYTAFLDSQADFMMSYSRYGWLNPWWASTLDDTGTPQFLFEDSLNSRSQDQPPLYCPSGAIWMARTSALRQHKTFHGPNKKAFILDWREAVDIDTPEDWSMAEIIYDYMIRA